MKKDVIKRIIDEYQGDDLAGFISDELKAIRGIQIRVSSAASERKREDEDHARRILDIHRRLVAAQADCRHWDFSFHGDPSGGNDSFHRCEICGKEW